MKIKILKFKDGTAEVPIGKIYSKGANLKEEIGIQIGKSAPISIKEVEAPSDFFKNRGEYKVKKEKIIRFKR